MKKIKWVLLIIVSFLVGFFGTHFFSGSIDQFFVRYEINWVVGLSLLIGLVISFIIHIIVHEIGHLLAGLLSGYSFAMFRLFHIVWVREGKAIKRRKQKTVGILGQCLMVPPQEQEYPPYKLYHLGGGIMNLLFSLLAWMMIQLLGDMGESILQLHLYLFMLCGIVLVVSNWIPSGSNDGKNLWKSWRYKEYQKSIALTLRIYAKLAKGVDFSEIEQDIWFNPKEEATGASNAFMTSIKTAAYMMENQYDEALTCVLPLLEKKEELIEPHKIEIAMTGLTLLLLTDSTNPLIEELIESPAYKITKELKQVDAKRTVALVEWIINNDKEKAQAFLKQAKELIEKAPTLADQKMEEKLIEEIEVRIKETSVEE
jgi:hypothetical protein